MVPFVIVADLRTGSTLLSSSLDRHPEVRCCGELFHSEDLPDNQLSNGDRHQMSGREVLRHFFTPGFDQAIGFRAMVFLPFPSAGHWADAWDGLADVEDLRVVWLTRRNRLAQYASILVAERTGMWHPSPGDPVLRPENRPAITIDHEEFRSWLRGREELEARRRESLRGKRILDVNYETLTSDWPVIIRGIQDFLSVEPVELAQAKQVQERRPLSEVISNYDELAAYDLR